MEKIALQLGLKKDATGAAILKAIKELQEKYNAQCELGVEYTKFKGDLQEAVGADDVQGILNVIQEHTESKKEVEENLTRANEEKSELKGQLEIKATELKELQTKNEELKTQKAKGAKPKKDIDARVKEFFKGHPEIKQVFVTDDGTIFFANGMAVDHMRTIGGVVHEYKQK